MLGRGWSESAFRVIDQYYVKVAERQAILGDRNWIGMVNSCSRSGKIMELWSWFAEIEALDSTHGFFQ